MIHALLVDDDAELRTLLAGYLTQFQMQVTPVADGAGLRRALANAPLAGFDVLLLDLMLPDVNGLDLCRWLRQPTQLPRHLPIIMLTAQGDPASRIIGLELGADDYLPKPFEPRELVARIHAVLRRSGPASAPGHAAEAAVLRFAGWRFDRLQQQLSSPQQVLVTLSNAEHRLLSTFVRQPKRVLSREYLLASNGHGSLANAAPMSASPEAASALRAIDLTVSRLRQKLGDSAREPELIRTVRGEGYLFNAEVSR